MSLSPPTDHHKHRVAERKLYGVEGSSTFLECIPKSLQAKVTWTFQKHPQNPRAEVRRTRGDVLRKRLSASNIFRRFFFLTVVIHLAWYLIKISYYQLNDTVKLLFSKLHLSMLQQIQEVQRPNILIYLIKKQNSDFTPSWFL